LDISYTGESWSSNIKENQREGKTKQQRRLGFNRTTLHVKVL